MKQIWDNLTKVKQEIKGLHYRQFSHAHVKVAEFRSELEQVQMDPSMGTADETQKLERDTIDSLRYWSKIEDNILHQKSRITWLTQGDSNTKFFFAAVKIRKAQNSINMLQAAQGIITSPEDIHQELVQFYQNLLGTCASSLEAIDLPVVKRGATLSLEASRCLIEPVRATEIDNALSNIDDNKAPGVDGFNALFFKKIWHLINTNVYQGVQEFLQAAECV